MLSAASGQNHYTKTVIIAVGIGILHFKKLEVEGAERFKVANFHYEKIKP
ncbi:hypothetical protein CHCC20335_4702 [Bacillus paralicheniformis]|nr:hypothetical protein CHCC20335_4702 [Bacillus paralicheniformis]